MFAIATTRALMLDLRVGCAACGASLWDDRRVFSFARGRHLCAACSRLRGGIYDERIGEWVEPPDVRDVD